MVNAYDIIYSALVVLGAPYWLSAGKARRKVLKALAQRMGSVAARPLERKAIMIHAVSNGEMNATPLLVDKLLKVSPQLHIIISTTTETGYERAQELYGKAAHTSVVRYPLDFSWAVRRFLNHLRPDAVVLMELEAWPNFLKACARLKIPVVLANGRLSAGSFGKYRWIKPVTAAMFRRMSAICAQDQVYAQRFIALGAPPAKVRIAGTMKFDTAQLSGTEAGSAILAADVGLLPGKEPIWVCGSTGPGEESIILEQYRQLLHTFPGVRLVIVPRHRQRFDEVAGLIQKDGFKLIRRSQGRAVFDAPPTPPVVLGDTMGELRKFYGLADVIFVGRSLVDLGSRQHGSDMIEAAAVGRPVIVGPWTGNFAEAVRKLSEASGLEIVQDGRQLGTAVAELLASAEKAAAMGARARQVVEREVGATDRHVAAIMQQLAPLKSPTEC